MISSMPERFGSPSFFRLIRGLWTEDQEQASILLMDQARLFCRLIARNSKSGFYDLSREDLEDYCQEAWLALWQRMEDYLANPMNDPDSPGDHYSPREQFNWAWGIVLNAMRHARDRWMSRSSAPAGKGRISFISLDQPLGGENSSTTVGELIPSQDPLPEEILLSADTVETAIRKLFSLPNKPETLAAVGYVILAGELDHKNRTEKKPSMEDYAAIVNRLPVGELVARMESMLLSQGYDPSCLNDFQARVRAEGAGNIFPEITGKKMINRKNDIQSALRKRMEE